MSSLSDKRAVEVPEVAAVPAVDEHRHHHRTILTQTQFDEYVRTAAYYIWLSRGEGVEGTDRQDWARGMAQIRSQYRVAETDDIVSFAAHILGLFQQIDIDHMAARGVLLADYAYMSDATDGFKNAKSVFIVLKNQQMPPGGPFWSEENLDLYVKWMADGYRP